jgi:hypothetical protein
MEKKHLSCQSAQGNQLPISCFVFLAITVYRKPVHNRGTAVSPPTSLVTGLHQQLPFGIHTKWGTWGLCVVPTDDT